MNLTSPSIPVRRMQPDALNGCFWRLGERLQQRREVIWAWLSALALVLCWDVSGRLDQFQIEKQEQDFHGEHGDHGGRS